jgi:hypothetical protein
MPAHNQAERWRRFMVAVMVAMFIGGVIHRPGFAQDDDERRLWDTEFLKKRQPAKTASPACKPPVYRRTTAKAAAADNQTADN